MLRDPPERSDARDAALDALLPIAARAGFGAGALRRAAGPEADLLFPGGIAEVIEALIDLADRRMVAAANLEGMGMTKRVRTLVATRLEMWEPHKPALRRACAMLALPHHAPLAARCTARTVDAIWHAAGDTSADFNWYTKRALLAGIYSATLLYWLNGSTSLEQALAFLDRRLAGVGQINKLKARLTRSAA